MKVCNHLSEGLSQDLELCNLKGKLVTVKFKTTSFDVLSRSAALELPTNSQKIIASHAVRILKSMLGRSPGIKLRLLGVRMSNFDETDGKQATLSQLFRAGGRATSPEQETDANTEKDLSKDSEALPSQQPGPSRSRSPSPPMDEPPLFDEGIMDDLDENQLPLHPTEAPTERQESKSPEVLVTESLIEETYCPVCAVIMRKMTETKVNRHINICLNREETREKLKKSGGTSLKLTPKPNKSRGIAKKRVSNNSKKRDIPSITNFFNK